MRLRIGRGASVEEVDVDLAAKTVRLRGRTYPFEIVQEGATKVELEIAGEKVVVDGWPTGFASPPGPVDVNGERGSLTSVERDATGAAAPPARREGPTAPGPATGAPAPVVAGPGMAIVPPMPGKVIEVRVRDGQAVAKGDVLVVVEAMKMRNEIASPVDGVVAQLAVRAGSNVRARDAMLRIVPPP